MTETQPYQRPRYHRIELKDQILATFNGQRAVLVNVSLSGILVTHQKKTILETKVMVTFEWNGDAAEIECLVVRTDLHRGVGKPGSAELYRSGLKFLRFVGNSEATVRSMLGDLVARALDEQKANARGIPPVAASSYQSGRRTVGFMTLRLVAGDWKRARTTVSLQPIDGFTVSADEEPSQIELLCEAYEKASTEDRKLLRSMAELSISSAEGVPARRYDP